MDGSHVLQPETKCYDPYDVVVSEQFTYMYFALPALRLHAEYDQRVTEDVDLARLPRHRSQPHCGRRQLGQTETFSN